LDFASLLVNAFIDTATADELGCKALLVAWCARERTGNDLFQLRRGESRGLKLLPLLFRAPY